MVQPPVMYFIWAGREYYIEHDLSIVNELLKSKTCSHMN